MAVYCSEECRMHPICDFCKHYGFNANEAGAYTGDGWCRLHQEARDPLDECEDFHCYTVD